MKKNDSWLLIILLALIVITIFTGALLIGKDEPDYVELKPQIVISVFYRHQLMFRALVTNDTIINIGPETNRMDLKVDWFYGNNNGIKMLDNNER